MTIETGELTYALEDLLRPRGGVYGGAAPRYPLGGAWQRDPELSSLRFGRASMTSRLTHDALTMANVGGLFQPPATTRLQVSGEVRMLLPGGPAVVRLD